MSDVTAQKRGKYGTNGGKFDILLDDVDGANLISYLMMLGHV